MRLLVAALAGVVLAFVAYAFAADITGSTVASIVAAVVGLVVGSWAVLGIMAAVGTDRRGAR